MAASAAVKANERVEKPGATRASRGRATCYRCLRPTSMCVCGRAARVHNRTGVIILQHPREARHPFGTARLATLYLDKVRLEVARGGWDRILRHRMDLPAATALLYPTAAARVLAEVPAVERPAHLLVLDGTWSQAGRLLRDNPWLWSLPQVMVMPGGPDRYRLRKEPKPHYLSTIESIALGLQVLEPENDGIARLLTVFDAVVSEQLAHTHRRSPRWHVRRAVRRIPARRIRLEIDRD